MINAKNILFFIKHVTIQFFKVFYLILEIENKILTKKMIVFYKLKLILLVLMKF